MKYAAFLTALFAAAPALAHEGMHIHPHGLGEGTMLLLGSLIGGAVVAVALKIRK